MFSTFSTPGATTPDPSSTNPSSSPSSISSSQSPPTSPPDANVFNVSPLNQANSSDSKEYPSFSLDSDATSWYLRRASQTLSCLREKLEGLTYERDMKDLWERGEDSVCLLHTYGEILRLELRELEAGTSVAVSAGEGPWARIKEMRELDGRVKRFHCFVGKVAGYVDSVGETAGLLEGEVDRGFRGKYMKRTLEMLVEVINELVEGNQEMKEECGKKSLRAGDEGYWKDQRRLRIRSGAGRTGR
ncbi:MAG: hypothetical protein Q9227_004592 [Pyrenula ochraceoflavens]